MEDAIKDAGCSYGTINTQISYPETTGTANTVMEVNRIVHGDCLDAMRGMADNSVDLVVTDPPYNIKKADWDDIDNYIAWITTCLQECLRLLTPRGSIYVMASQRFMPFLFVELSRIAIWRNTIIWHYTNGLGSNTHFSMRYEPIMFFSKTDDYCFDVDPLRTQDWAHNRGCEKGYHPKGRNPTDVWQIHRLVWNNSERVDHPTQKPLELFSRMIVVSSSKGDLVFDPFMGSGTTAIAAENLGRNWKGIEKEEKYVQMANNRIAKERLRRSQLLLGM